MRRAVDHAAMSACGYATPWSVRAGQAVALHASCDDPSARVGLRRLDGPAEPVSWPVSPEHKLGCRTLLLGSWIEIDDLAFAPGAALRIEALITRNATPRTLLGWGDVAVTIDPERRVALRVAATASAWSTALPAWRWLAFLLTLTETSVDLTVADLAQPRAVATVRVATAAVKPGAAPLTLGRDADGPAANWRLGRVAFEAAGRASSWRFPVRGPVDHVPPMAGAGPVLRVLNDPTFACASARWHGGVHDPRLAPDQYDAIHLHEDDCSACDWPVTHRVDVPAEAESGVYAFEVATASGTERVAFFVRPARPRAAIAFLAPTLTYAAYADEALPPERYPWACDDRAHRFARANGLLSLYDVHADGGGVCLKSLRHPKATLRDDYLYPLSGSPHLLPVDLRLLAFCHAEGIAFDVLTDGDLHAEGVEALAPYAGVFTGSHPEYWTSPMQDALRDWLEGGGNLAHLGGNGLMWVTAFDGDRVEVRRGQTLASRTWSGLPGELGMALTGEIGGLWRERGRSEFSVVGTGMTLMGFGPARPFHRLPASYGEDWAWVFEGVGDEPIGDTGSVLGGAAGYEVDRVDERLGTPPGTIVMARAEGFGPEYLVDGNDYCEGGAAELSAARRADLAARRHEGGGIVLSVGSVAWCGALPGPGERNAVGLVTATILRRLGATAGA